MCSRDSVGRALLLVSVPLCSCSSSSGADVRVQSDAFTSAEARILDFEFEGTVVVSDGADANRAIVSQIKYAQGILRSASNASGHVGSVTLSDVVDAPLQARADHVDSVGSALVGNVSLAVLTDAPVTPKRRLAYRASLTVAWPKDVTPPSSYELTLPLDTSALDAFNSKYDGACGKGAGGQDDLWQAWNPRADSCSIDQGDVMHSQASIAADGRETIDKYPEYDRIWDDDRLDAIAVFGLIESKNFTDWGYEEEKRFVESVGGQLEGAKVTANPTSASVLGDRTITGMVMLGGRPRNVKIDVLIVDGLDEAGADFDARYDPLSETADMILYSGHARHGRNIEALVRKGRVVAGRYQLVLLNGCESFAHVDTTLTDRRREANGAMDPNGTRFLDVVTNAQPGYASNLAKSSLVLLSAALTADTPLSYGQIIGRMPENHVVVVYGEEDNTFSP